MSFEYDIFISYGRLDNEDPDEEEKGWIDLFHRRLSVRVGQALGFAPVIWRDDHDLRGSDDLEGAINYGVTRSLLFVPVVTPRYVRSGWCNREASAFNASALAAGDAAPPFRSRVFKVVKTPLPESLGLREPEPLKKLLGYNFYAEDKLKGRVSEYSPDKSPRDKRYWRVLEGLVGDIAKRLQELKEHSPGVRLAGPPATPEAPPPPDDDEGEARRKVVYLAETTGDLTKERDAVRDELRQRGHVVLPESKLPLDSKDALAEAVRADLARASLSVHLVGARYGSTPEDDERSVVHTQELLAAERREADSSFRRLIWMPPGLSTPASKVTDARQSAFIEGLQERVADGAELLQKTVTIEDLKTLIVEKLSPPHEPAADAGARPGKRKHVYLIFEDSDWDFVEPIQSHLINEKLEVITWYNEEAGESLMKGHHRCLKECDAALIYFGSADEFWVRKNLNDLENAYCYGRVEDWRASAVYVGAPPSQRKKFFATQRALVIRGLEGFDPDKLNDFVSAVRD